jgi:hypothetical protein
MSRIGLISTVLEPFIFLYRRAVRQMHPVSSFLQTIHQPVPVVCVSRAIVTGDFAEA